MLLWRTKPPQSRISKNLEARILQECRLNTTAIVSSLSSKTDKTFSTKNVGTRFKHPGLNSTLLSKEREVLNHASSSALNISTKQLHTTSTSQLITNSSTISQLYNTNTTTSTNSVKAYTNANNVFATNKHLFNSRKNITYNSLSNGCFSLNLASSFHTGSVRCSENVTGRSEAPSAEVSDPAVDLSETTSGVSDVVSDVVSESDHLWTEVAELSFRELGLCSAYPPGMVQMLMESLHIQLDLPWWQVIGLTTVLLRIIVFPIVIIAQRNMVRMSNHQPEIQKLQVAQQMASIRGDKQESMMLYKALMKYFREHNCHPVKSFLPVMFQGSFFMSMFFGLRGMAECPVPSMTTGGIHWFTDLTVADPIYLLPLLTSSTLLLTLYLGSDGINTAAMPPIMKKLLYSMPLLSFPIMMQFPAALNLYWLINNIISACQGRVVRHPAIREKFGIEEQIMWKESDLPLNSMNQEIKKEAERQRRESEKFNLQKKKDQYIEMKKKEQQKRDELLQSFREEQKGKK